MKIEFLGQAGLFIEENNSKLLCDPWVSESGGFLARWHQYPPNMNLDLEKIKKTDYLYISHSHRDHFDREFLKDFSEDIPFFIANYVSKKFIHEIEEIGFKNIIELNNWEKYQLNDDLAITLIKEPTLYKDDSTLIVESKKNKIFNKNDCYLSPEIMDELSQIHFDIIFSQFSGAMHYPIIYNYPKSKKDEISKNICNYLIDQFIKNTNQLETNYVVPSAGPPCFLEDDCFEFNFKENGIFPDQNDIIPDLTNSLNTKFNLMQPGDTVTLDGDEISFNNNHSFDFSKKKELLLEYKKIRLPKIQNYLQSIPEPPENLYEKFTQTIKNFAKKNSYITSQIGQLVEFNIKGIHGGVWQIDFRNGMPVFYQQAKALPQYRFNLEGKLLNLVCDERISWEELFLSLRITAERDPDLYNWPLFALLRYGHDKTLLDLIQKDEQEKNEKGESITIKNNGKDVVIQRYCPHNGEDLKSACIENGVLTCSRHNWKFDLNNNGKCTFGGNKDLKIFQKKDIMNNDDE